MKTKLSDTLISSLGTLLFLFVVVPLLWIWLPRQILISSDNFFFFDIGLVRYFGLVPIVIGVVILIYCSGSFVFVSKSTPIPFSSNNELIVTGLYRFVRNPLYIAAVLVLAGQAILFQSVGIVIYCLITFGVFNVIVLMEETLLEEQFGVKYELYRKSVPRWIPRFKPVRIKDSGSKKKLHRYQPS